MKPEYRIDISENGDSSLEAPSVLSEIDPDDNFYSRYDLRPPLGIYNASISRISNRVTKCCKKLEPYFKEVDKVYDLKDKDGYPDDLIESLELALYAAAEHVDDLKLIAKSFYPDIGEYKSCQHAKRLGNVIKKDKTLISSTVNAIKHRQSRIRIFALEIVHAKIFKSCLYGYFIEGTNKGAIGTDKILHINKNVFSITSILWEIICFVLSSSRNLTTFLKDVTKIQSYNPKITDKPFSEAVIAISRLPLYSLDDRHPFADIRIIVVGDLQDLGILDSGIYGSITKKWSKSREIEFGMISVNYQGDGVSKKFDMIQPKKFSLQHWG